MLFTKLVATSAVLLAPLSTSALSFVRPDLVLNGESPISVNTRWTWEDCGAPEDIVHIKSIEVSPDPPQPGKDLTVIVNGIADENIEEGAYADVTVKLGLIKLLQKQFDICEEARNANATIQCPIAAGEHKVVQTVALPKEIPRAKFNVLAQGYSADDEDLMCVKITIDFILGHNLCSPGPVFSFASTSTAADPALSLPTPTSSPVPRSKDPGSCLTIERLARCEAELGGSNTLARALDALPPRGSGYHLVTLNREEADEYVLSAGSLGRDDIRDAYKHARDLYDGCAVVQPEPPRVTKPVRQPDITAYLTPPSSPETGPERGSASNEEVDDLSLDAESTLVDDCSNEPQDLIKDHADNDLGKLIELDLNESLEHDWYEDDDDYFEYDEDDFDDNETVIESSDEMEATQEPLPASNDFGDLRKFTASPVNLPDLTPALDPSSFPEWSVARGGFGEVWKGDIIDKSRAGRETVAVKRLTMYSNRGEEGARKVLKRTTREIYIWSRLRHRNILPLLGFCAFRGGIGLVSPWQEAGNATAWVNENPGVNRLGLCEGICAGLAYLHEHDVIHGDLRGANVLISPKGTPRLIDFGLATVVGGIPAFSESSSMAGTVRWMAPELQVENHGTTRASDIFALGMTMLEMYTGAPPFSSIRNDLAVLLKYQRGERPSRPDISHNKFDVGSYDSDDPKSSAICVSISDLMWDLIQNCWDQHPDNRPTAKNVLRQIRRQRKRIR
ncbi:Tyrosine-protein kinase [Ceratobasidium sp. AG-Ba]|nr:Tyrosine-protein kinase [Ceratobasidium sp. AG-Ba]